MILVTGATGQLGSEVVRVLRELDEPVRALVRKGSEYYWLNNTGCSYFFGDLRDPASLRRACRGVRGLLACSGVHRETTHNNHSSLTVQGHLDLWQAAAERGVSRAVFASAVGVDRAYPTPWFDARLQAEVALRDSGIPWSVLRFTPFTSLFARMARRGMRTGRVWLPGPGHNQVAPIGARTAALHMVAALDLPEAQAGVLEVAGAEVMSARRAVERAVTLGGGNAVVRHIPGFAVRAAGRAVGVVGRRWTHHLDHQRRWFSDDFVAPMDSLDARTGIQAENFEAAVLRDLERMALRSDPVLKRQAVVHRRFDATVYHPGEVALDSLPRGPLRYD